MARTVARGKAAARRSSGKGKKSAAKQAPAKTAAAGPAAKSAATSAQKTAGRPPAKAAARSTVKAAGRSVAKTAGRSAAKAAGRPAAKAAGRSVAKTAGKSAAKAASRSSLKTAAPKAAARRGGKQAAGAKAAPSRAAAAAKARRAAPAKRKSAARRSAPRKQPVRGPAVSASSLHHFVVSHLDEAAFRPDGLRAYAKYRDLGIAAATNGLCQAHVIRFQGPCTDEVRKRHTHSVDLQLVYVLQGWVKNEFAGHGEQMMSAGSCWLQPSGIEHTVLDYSADCELLEIVVPADFATTELT
jgi:hypothetical protein